MKKDDRLLCDATKFGQRHGESQAFGFCSQLVGEMIDKLPDGEAKQMAVMLRQRLLDQQAHAVESIRGDAK